MPGRTAEVVLIGGGVMGVSIAHHLAVEGVRGILLLEKRYIGAGASGKSGAIIRQHYSTDLLVRMARCGVQTFSDFEHVTGAPSGWQGSGCLVVAGSGDRAAVEGNVQLMRGAGAVAELANVGVLSGLVPQAEFAEDEVGAWEPEAGCVDAASILQGYADSARRLGVEIQCGTDVHDIEIDRDRLTAISTSSGRVATGTAVLCAGPWARRLAARAGLELPLTVVRPQVSFLRRPGDFGSGAHPVLADLPNGYYCRPEAGERTLIGALDISADEVVVNPDVYDEAASAEFLAWSRSRIARRLPAMERAFTRGGYGGLYTVTPDSHPILGEAPAIRGLYLATGFSGHGFKLSPAVGRGLAELIVHGAYRALDLTPLRATRFAEGQGIRSAYEYGLLS